MKRLTLIGFVLSLLACLACHTRSARGAQDNRPALDQLLWSENDVERDAAAKAIIASKRETLFQCYQIVLSMAPAEGRKRTVNTAIELLGHFRCVEAVPLLVENLSFSAPPADHAKPLRLEQRFPCLPALVEIGLPAVDPVVAKAEQEDDELVLNLTWHVVHRVLGPKLGVAYFEHRIAQQADPTIRARLQRMKEAVERGRAPSQASDSDNSVSDRGLKTR